MGQDLHTWEGAVKEEKVPHPGKSPHLQGDQPGQGESFRALEESAAASLQQPEQRETCTDGIAATLSHYSRVQRQQREHCPLGTQTGMSQAELDGSTAGIH